jgi:hypothetical protein
MVTAGGPYHPPLREMDVERALGSVHEHFEADAATRPGVGTYVGRPRSVDGAATGHIQARRVARGETIESVPTAEVIMSNIDEKLVLAHFIVSGDVERSRRFLHRRTGRQDGHLRRGE